LSDLTLILLSAGTSSRFEMNVKKQWLRIDHDPLWQFVTKRLSSTGLFSDIIVTAHADEVSFMQYYSDFMIIKGGRTRQESLSNALSAVKSKYVMVTDIARACIDPIFIKKLMDHREKADCIVPFLSVNDTVVYKDDTIERNDVKRVQTPQLSNTESLRAALQSKKLYTDESSAIVANGGTRYFVKGHEDAHKITYISDLKALPCLNKPSSDVLVGNGFDVHAFDEGGEMVLAMAGAMSTGEIGIILARMIREGKVHAVSCTAANLEEDLFNLFHLDLHSVGELLQFSSDNC